jgi:excisionase family DNA binding protein
VPLQLERTDSASSTSVTTSLASNRCARSVVQPHTDALTTASDRTLRAQGLSLALPEPVVTELVERIADRVLERLQAESTSTMTREFLSVPEAAELLRCRPQRIYDLLSDGRLERFKDGSRVLVRRADLVAHLLPRDARRRSTNGVAR